MEQNVSRETICCNLLKYKGNEMIKVIDSNYDIENGFAWVTLEDGSTIQACLKVDHGDYLPKIDMNYHGMDWGICGDVNHSSFIKHGEDECIKAFADSIEEIGVKLLNYNKEKLTE